MNLFKRKRRAPEGTVRVVNVIETANNTEDVSRPAMLRWINESLSLDYQKIEELCSGKEGVSEERLQFTCTQWEERDRGNRIVNFMYMIASVYPRPRYIYSSIGGV